MTQTIYVKPSVKVVKLHVQHHLLVASENQGRAGLKSYSKQTYEEDE